MSEHCKVGGTSLIGTDVAFISSEYYPLVLNYEKGERNWKLKLKLEPTVDISLSGNCEPEYSEVLECLKALNCFPILMVDIIMVIILYVSKIENKSEV